jgi:hypothetical protein
LYKKFFPFLVRKKNQQETERKKSMKAKKTQQAASKKEKPLRVPCRKKALEKEIFPSGQPWATARTTTML